LPHTMHVFALPRWHPARNLSPISSKKQHKEYRGNRSSRHRSRHWIVIAKIFDLSDIQELRLWNDVVTYFWNTTEKYNGPWVPEHILPQCRNVHLNSWFGVHRWFNLGIVLGLAASEAFRIELECLQDFPNLNIIAG
jgi:hypothetical protein